MFWAGLFLLHTLKQPNISGKCVHEIFEVNFATLTKRTQTQLCSSVEYLFTTTTTTNENCYQSSNPHKLHNSSHNKPTAFIVRFKRIITATSEILKH